VKHIDFGAFFGLILLLSSALVMFTLIQNWFQFEINWKIIGILSSICLLIPIFGKYKLPPC